MAGSRAQNLHRPSFGRAAEAAALADDVRDERLVAYALTAEPVFAGMRALIGQLSGILLLAQARRRHDIPDLPDLPVIRERRREVADYLSRIEAPEERQADLRGLEDAMAHVDAAIGILAELGVANIDDGVASASRHLKTAYRRMQSACDHRLGLAMVDQRGACCSCGTKLP